MEEQIIKEKEILELLSGIKNVLKGAIDNSGYQRKVIDRIASPEPSSLCKNSNNPPDKSWESRTLTEKLNEVYTLAKELNSSVSDNTNRLDRLV